jgi:glycosyltransferase involved in cell wall biosynthesis
MRLAIDASRCTVSRVTGTETYALNLIRALIRHNPRHQITLYFRQPPPADLFPADPHVTRRVIPFPRLWTHLRFAAALWHDRPDLTFVPAHTLPALFPGRAAVTVNDLGYHYFPQAHPARQRLYLRWTTRHSARRAALVLADSRATAVDLTRFYGTPPDKIQVVYPGIETPPPPDAAAVAAVRARYDLPERYFLFVGTLQPRKNIARIAAAFRQWQAQHPGDPTALVLAGGRGWLFDPAWTQGIDAVRLTGYIDEADKYALYTGALALVFPSLYEGFGFPALEAMRCGAPVIASAASSLPELVGDAGLLVNALDTEAVAAAMSRLSDDDALRADLRARGLARVTTFTWDAAARQVWSLFEALEG